MAFGSSMDMYRKVPTDLLEATRRGSFFSVCAIITMATLFFLETRAFFTTTLVTDMAIDTNKESKVRVNFNITMLDLRCDYAVVDVVSVLGTEQNVSQNVNKWQLDAEGVKKRFYGRNKNQKDIIQHDESVVETIEELHENGEDATELDADTLEFAIKENRFLFVDFFASWCSHCIRLAPTWETLAEVMHEVAEETLEELLMDKYPAGDHGYSEEEYHAAARVHLPVVIAKVDCVKHQDLCKSNGIHAYPTLRLYVDGKHHVDYKQDRTIVQFSNFLSEVEQDYLKNHPNQNEEVLLADIKSKLPTHLTQQQTLSRRLQGQLRDEDHPGCQLSGHLLVDRVPGNFHIKARSNSHDLVPSMTNVSHEVHSLSFGEPNMVRMVERNKVIAPEELMENIQPMNGNVYINEEFHTAYHHNLKVVTTNHDVAYTYSNIRAAKSYQILAQTELSRYDQDVVPEAKFIYDLSPVAISYRKTSRKWYDYLTSVMAIIGGTFTVVGMMESTVYAVSSKKRR